MEYKLISNCPSTYLEPKDKDLGTSEVSFVVKYI